MFIKDGQGVFVHKSLLPTSIYDINTISIGDYISKALRITLSIGPHAYEVGLRFNTDDIAMFRQVFDRREYETSHLPTEADTIVDLGANVGFATVFFGLRYPTARIIAVEPSHENFMVLKSNAEGLGDRARLFEAAIWIEDGHIQLHAENSDGASLGESGFQVAAKKTARSRLVTCSRLSTLLAKTGIDTVDILKIDIEGAELELFSVEPNAWLPKIRLIMIETHDRFRPGSEQAVRAALIDDFEELPGVGESLLFRKKTIRGDGLPS